MASADQYRQRLQSMNLRFAGETAEEATAALEECTRLQGELRQMKGSVQLEIRSIRGAYEQRMVSPAPVASTLFTLFGKRRIAGSLRAGAKRGLRIDRDRAIEPYEAVKRDIDDLLHQLADAKRQLSQFVRAKKAGTRARASTGSAAKAIPSDQAAFCTHCGARIGHTDRFCRQCGAGTEPVSAPPGDRAVVRVSQEQPWLLGAKRLLAGGQKIHAIKLVREETDLSLKEAKDLVESWQSAPLSEVAPNPTNGAGG